MARIHRRFETGDGRDHLYEPSTEGPIMIFVAVVGRHLIWLVVSVDTGGALEQK